MGAFGAAINQQAVSMRWLDAAAGDGDDLLQQNPTRFEPAAHAIGSMYELANAWRRKSRSTLINAGYRHASRDPADSIKDHWRRFRAVQ